MLTREQATKLRKLIENAMDAAEDRFHLGSLGIVSIKKAVDAQVALDLYISELAGEHT